jgi:hypothetical protein
MPTFGVKVLAGSDTHGAGLRGGRERERERERDFVSLGQDRERSTKLPVTLDFQPSPLPRRCRKIPAAISQELH